MNEVAIDHSKSDHLDVRFGIIGAGIIGTIFLSIFPTLALPLRVLVTGTVLYLFVSIFYHPRHSILSSPFSPIVIFKALVIAAFCFNALYLAANKYDPSVSALTTSILMFSIGFIIVDTVSLGIANKNMNNYNARVGEVHRRTALTVFSLIYIGGWAWRVYALSQGLLYGTLLATSMEVTSYSNLLGTFGLLSSIAFSGLLVFGRRIGPFLLLLPLEIIWKWIGSSKAGLIYVILPVLLICHVRGIFRINIRTIVTGVMLILAFLISFVVIHEYRVESKRIILDEGYRTFSPFSAVRNVEVTSETVSGSFTELAERLGWSQGVAKVVDGMESRYVPFQNGSTYRRVFSWIVPRAIWPEKPDISLGGWFARTFYGWSASSRSEAEITIWGEAYLNYGFFGGALIPALWIILLQVGYGFCLRFGRWGLFLLGAAYVSILNSLAVNVAVTVAAVGQTLIIVMVLYLFVRVSVVIRSLWGSTQSMGTS